MNRVVVFLLLVFAFSACGVHREFANAEKKIPGTYNYVHSWNYKAPDGNGTIHCDELGTLRFYADGTYVDDAVQYHTLTMNDSILVPVGFGGDSTTIAGSGFKYLYHCEGHWRVENGHFLFNELAEGFSMTNVDNCRWSIWSDEYAALIAAHTTPNSNLWFTFDFERLDKEWFIWSYTYPNGRKDTWDMQRVNPNEANFGRN